MAKEHDVMNTINDLVDFSQTHPITKISIIGESGNGKTTFAQSLTHLLHKHMKTIFKLDYSVQCFYYPDIGKTLQNQNLQRTSVDHFFEEFYQPNMHIDDIFRSLAPNNYIITIDDSNNISNSEFMDNAEQVLENMVTVYRTRVFLLKTYFSHDFNDKDFEELDVFRYFVGTNVEFDYIKQKSSKKFHKHFDTFEHARKQIPYPIIYNLDNGLQISYNYKNPFIPCLFWNGKSTKNIVVPPREFIDKQCNICKKWHEMCYPARSKIK